MRPLWRRWRFERAIRAACNPILDGFRDEFRAQVTELEDGLGLYAAMARLPERQFDVMVLQFALGFTTKRTALVMAVCEATVPLHPARRQTPPGRRPRASGERGHP
ncbi:hypothetical protein ACFVHS_43350 [Streptomyces sp. NPDC057746]|uniref:hypothetical protein n=1 Tax=Streptomyces sp. NPDC057746 TaxID=3346237 RepID=UPI0036AB97B6